MHSTVHLRNLVPLALIDFALAYAIFINFLCKLYASMLLIDIISKFFNGIHLSKYKECFINKLYMTTGLNGGKQSGKVKKRKKKKGRQLDKNQKLNWKQKWFSQRDVLPNSPKL